MTRATFWHCGRLLSLVTFSCLAGCNQPKDRPGATTVDTTPMDTAVVAALLTRLADTARGARDSALAEIRAVGARILPSLAIHLHSTDRMRSGEAAVALVSMGPAALTVIRVGLKDTTTVFALHEALQWAPNSDSAAMPLLNALYAGSSEEERVAAVVGANTYREGGAAVGGLLLRALKDPIREVRNAAISEVIQVRDSAVRLQASLLLARLLDDTSASVRRNAVYSLGNMGDVAGPGIAGIVERIRSDTVAEIRWLSARVLGWIGPRASDAVPELLIRTRDRSEDVRRESLGSLGGIGTSRLRRGLADSVIATLSQHVKNARREIRLIAVAGLGAVGRTAIPSLIRAVASPDDSVRVAAIRELGGFPDEPAIAEPLLGLLDDSRASVRKAAAYALAGMGAPVVARLQEVQRSRPGRGAAAAAMALRVHEAAYALPIARTCYRIEHGAWTPPLESESIEGVLPPRTLRFSTVWVGSFREDSLSFRVEQRHDSTWYPTGYWVPRIREGAVDLDASPSLSGIRMRLSRSPDGVLRGTMRTYWDFTRESEQATVTGYPVDCGS